MKKIVPFLLIINVLSFTALSQSTQIPISTIDKILVVIENQDTPPLFPAGQTSWIKFLQKNLNANVATNNKAPNGEYIAVVSFVVDSLGHVHNINPKTNFGYGIEEEVTRVLKLSLWVPAVWKNQHVNANKTISITVVSDFGSKKSIK